MSLKIDRLESTYVKEISYILSNEVKNKRLNFIVVTDCKITSDLSYAKVDIRLLNEDDKKEILAELKGASKFIRKELSERVDVRHTPELEFVYDESIEYAKNIENIIDYITTMIKKKYSRNLKVLANLLEKNYLKELM